jgi:hypothetical protein
MKNPLYPSKLIDKTTISNFNKCYVITLEKTHIPEIFNEDVDQSTINKIKDNYKLSLIPMWMIKFIPEYQKKFLMYELSEDDLLKFNFLDKDLNDDQIIYDLTNACIFVPNHNWFWFYQFIEIYLVDGFKQLNKYIMDDTYATLDIPFDNLLKEIERSTDVTYWKNRNRCMINITSPWLERDINFSDAKEININTQKQMTDKCNDYLQLINNKNKYVDASSGIKSRKYNLYYIDEPSNLKLDVAINKIINDNEITPQHKFNIINNGLISKKYCHHFIKNINIINYINMNLNSFIKNFGYTWLMMYLEEGILKSRITENDRCVFTLEQARHLPFDNQNANVYVPLMVEKTYINFIGGYKSTSNNNKIELSNMIDFRYRLNTFINNNGIDIFKNMDWSNIAISGSVIPATCRKIDPMERDGNYITEDFFNTYYKDSDIDVMCDLQDYVLFIDKINYMVSVFKQNILENYPNSKDPIQVEITKNAVIQFSKKYIDENYNGKMTDLDAYHKYCELKNKEKKQTNTKYIIIDSMVPFDQFKYYVYNNDELKEPFVGENIKYHISSPHLTRKFEVFKIKYNFLATVSRFHLPCVRGYYNGKDVYLLPSAISALLTNKCMDYKYFAGVRSPFEILLKYVFRGFTIFLNKKEIVKLYEYIKNSDKWKNMYDWQDHYRLATFQTYYSNPFALLNKNVKYFDNRKYVEHTMISPIVSSIGYVIPL